MKIGRNELCPCGSGKKYKKCCLSEKTVISGSEKKSANVPDSKHYFSIKGTSAEVALHELAEKTFLTDWCYLKPVLPNGNELCDLLIVFDDIAIIWQVKNTKLQNDNFLKKSDVEKNLKQLSGARRQLFELQTQITLKNLRRGTEIFDPTVIREIYLISAFFGEPPEGLALDEMIKGSLAHVFTQRFTEIVLNELDTISDFCEYIRAKESLFREEKELTLIGGEENLLVYYLRNNRSFEEFKKHSHIVLEGDFWDDLKRHPQYIAKKKADKISYAWDGMIGRAHTGDNLKYERIARELARPNRVERRFLSKGFMGAQMIAHESNRTFRRFVSTDKVVYCFLFQDDPEPRNKRKSHLAAMCHVARSKNKNRKIIGIATEKKIRPACSYDFAFFEIQDWSADDQRLLGEIEKQGDILRNPKKSVVREEEYPNIGG